MVTPNPVFWFSGEGSNADSAAQTSHPTGSHLHPHGGFQVRRQPDSLPALMFKKSAKDAQVDTTDPEC